MAPATTTAIIPAIITSKKAGASPRIVKDAGAAGDRVATCTLTVAVCVLVPAVALIVIAYSPGLPLLHVRVLVPEDWMLVELRLHEMPARAATAIVTAPVNPLLEVTIILVMPGLPASILMEPEPAEISTSGGPASVTATTIVIVCEWDLLIPVIVTV